MSLNFHTWSKGNLLASTIASGTCKDWLKLKLEIHFYYSSFIHIIYVRQTNIKFKIDKAWLSIVRAHNKVRSLTVQDNDKLDIMRHKFLKLSYDKTGIK